MDRICDRRRCVGCGVCATVCGSGAVTMLEDINGFVIPKINPTKCISCGLCVKHCPVNNDLTHDRMASAKYYGGCANSKAEVCTSTSGGLASVFARTVMRDGGVVFGAAYDPFPIVRHVRIDNEFNIDRLKGSKYVESDLKGVMNDVRSALSENRRVLFVGLPCHVAAIRSYIGGDDKNLTTIDLVCHGKPPQKLFTHWIHSLESSRQKKICGYRFRVKDDCQWNDARTYLHFCSYADGSSERISSDENWYGRYFLGASTFRESCYHCQYAKLPRVGDMTLADFWGAEKNPAFSAMIRGGCSLLSVQSRKGMRLLEESKHMLECVPVPSDFVLNANGGLVHPSKRPIYRNFVYAFVYRSSRVVKICDWLLFGLGKFAKRCMPAL